MPTNPTPAAVKAAEAIIADRTPFSLMVSREKHLARIIDAALEEERRAGDELVTQLEALADELDEVCRLPGESPAWGVVAHRIRRALPAYRAARGQG